MSNIAPTGTLINLWCIVRENRSFQNYYRIGTNVASNILRNKETVIEPYLNEKLKDPADTVGNIFQNVIGNNIRVIVDVPVIEQPVAVGSKRSFDEMQVDRTDLICDILIQPFDTVPNRANDFKPLVDTKLIRKLPVSFCEERKFPQFAEYIQTSDDECGNMVHWGIDSLIRIPLQIFRESLGGGLLPIEMDRNSKDQGTTAVGNKRPDFLCWTNDVLLFKGEEKADAKDFPIAERELEDKCNKFDPLNFGNIQFMLCYAVAGPNLRFYAIDGSPNANPLNRLVSLSNRLDIKNSRDRVSILCIVVNIARIIRTVNGRIPGSIVPIGKRMKLEKSTITFFDDSCSYRVSLVTRNDYVHCDIRLPNIVFVPGVEDYKCVLIDFEHSNMSGFSPSELLRDWDGRTLNKKNKYTIQSDLYQFGKMLRNP
ncbi:hypothetical protein C1646_751569 [Rhizophagus diaphanus]|nr:hypothetical protein C1646_751569 [Rhizophagus diaphanus] [Rhizophagus sp. MUCL 43196]